MTIFFIIIGLAALAGMLRFEMTADRVKIFKS